MRVSVLLLLIGCSLATNVNWVSSENDKDTTAIPLSASYRESLRKLCAKLKDGYKVPNEQEVRKMCNKLAQDDNNISLASTFSNPIALIVNNKKLILLSITFSTIIYFFMNSKNSVVYIFKNIIGNILKGLFVLKKGATEVVVTQASNSGGGDAREYVRAMRLRAMQRGEAVMASAAANS